MPRRLTPTGSQRAGELLELVVRLPWMWFGSPGYGPVSGNCEKSFPLLVRSLPLREGLSR